MSLFNAMNANAKTENGAAAYHSTLNSCLDFFFQAGSSRGKDITTYFAAAMGENKEYALRTLLWLRDREGAGERQQFKNLIAKLIKTEKEDLVKAIILKVPLLGRFDDLFVFFDTKYQDFAVSVIVNALQEGNGLAAKWMPRKGPIFKAVSVAMGYESAKPFRKLLVGLTNVVETQMCAGEWDKIDFSKLPSVASARYQKAFNTNAESTYTKYKEGLESETTTINAGAVYPYDVIKSLNKGDHVVANAQWKALPDYMEGSNERILPVVDVSGSMGCPAGGNSTITCMDVAISLGMYISERNTGVFKDQFITFSENPRMHQLKGDLHQRYSQLSCADWGMSTNLEAVFDQVLSQAVKHKVPEEQMPTKIMILSDMQFNRCVSDSSITLNTHLRNRYTSAGYKIPQVVFWNLNSTSNVPVTKDTSGVSLVSGFSPSLLKALLGEEEFTPESVMLDVIMNDRYAL